MKRLLAFFMLLLFAQSCIKEYDVLLDSETTSRVTFSASMAERDATTKAITLKDSWNEGDQIAIFIDNGDDTYSDPYCYDIATDGTMTPAEGEDGIIVVVRSEDVVNYHAFFPYDSSLSSYDEYKAASEIPNGDTDFLFTQASGITEVEFTFSHTLAAIYFNILTSGSNIVLSYTLDGQYTNTIELDNELNNTTGRYNSSFFIEETEDLSSALLIISVDGEKIYFSLQNDEVTSWEAGKIYSYNITLSTGSGTESDPFIIISVEEMEKVGTGTDGWNLDSHYKLYANLNLEGSESNPWTPIGTSEDKFTGTFDGNNNMISGLYINDSSSDYQGLFGCIDSATIKNLSVSGEVAGNYYVGGLAGNAYTSYITNCYNEATVVGARYVGGIIGYASDISITNCYNSAKISGDGKYIGGVIGRTSDSSSSVTYCYNTGEIATTANYVGGVVGYSFSPLTNCYNTATVEGKSYVGGVAGSACNVSVIKCYNTADVIATSNYVGGVVGEYYNTDSDTPCIIINCHNTGDVTATDTSSECVGGIIGEFYTFNGSSIAAINCYNTADVTANSYVGGIIGISKTFESIASVTTTNCYSTGKISGTNSVGGIVGDIYTYSTVNNCYYNSDNYSGDVVGTETDVISDTTSTPSSDTVIDSEGKTTDEMQSESFLYLLNLATYTYNNTAATAACYWVSSSSYPTFDYDGSIGQLGSENNPFMIFSVEDMKKIGTGTDSWSLSAHYKLAVDLNLEGSYDNQWTPIGTYTTSTSTRFSGSFDGNNLTISGLYIDSSSGGYLGLFGGTYGATIKNLGVKGSLTAATTTNTYIAGLIGYAENSSINNCHFDGSVTVTSNSSSEISQNVGGVAGRSSNTVITKCYNRANISATNNRILYNSSYGQYVGGVVGYAATTSKLTNCYNTGEIKAYSYRYTQHIGGVIGYIISSFEVDYCYNAGLIEVTTNSSTQYLGGLIGSCGISAVATLNYCYYNEDYFTGELYNTSSTSASITITNSESKTDDEMKSSDFADLLNSGQSPVVWKSDSESENSGYPILISE